MKIQQFEDLIAWQKAQDLAVHVYKSFSAIKDFGFKNQIFDASVSISNNIAEGFEYENSREFNRFLKYSKGSCGEVRSMSYLAFKLSMINEPDKVALINESREVSRIIKGLQKSLSANQAK